MTGASYPLQQGLLSRLCFNALTFWISHLFLFPLFAVIGISAALLWTEYDARVCTGIAASFAAYAYWSYGLHSKATRTGSWFDAASPFSAFWLGCHQYFPVRTLMWDAISKQYVDQPTEGHKATYPVDKRTHIFAMAPHGALPVGAAVLRPQLSRWQWLSSRIRVGAADAVFALPIVRELFLLFGSVRADKRTCLHQLKQGNSVLLLPGGIREQLYVCKPNQDAVVLKDRKGFVRLALETGSPIVPVYVFGERQAYKVNGTVTRLVSTMLKRLFNVGVPLVRGRWLLTLMPFPVPITLVFGRPIEVPQQFKRPVGELLLKHHQHHLKDKGSADGAADREAEMEAAVDALHSRFCEALIDLYAEHRDSCGHEGIELLLK